MLFQHIKKTKFLADAMVGKSNNLNIIRIIAASLVLFSHSFTVVTGDLSKEPLRVNFGITLGSIAVDVFLIISGLLVTTSLVKGKNPVEFIKGRILRIWPGLTVSFILTVYVLGAFVTKSDPEAYFLSSPAFIYFYKGLLLSQSTSFIPGVFTNNPAGPGFNASLWTLAVEVRMYTYLLLTWLVSRLAGKRKESLFFCTILFIFIHYAARHFGELTGAVENSSARLPFMFFCGSLLTLTSKKIILSPEISAVAILLLVFATVQGREIFFIIYSLTLPFLVIFFSYSIDGIIRRYNSVGDYSFGLYIYAWPIQQALMVFFPKIGVAENQIAAFVLTLLVAILSWRFVEKPALEFKHRGKHADADRGLASLGKIT